MTNLDSILKSRDITLPTKFCLVKSMVFPVVMYGCESWTIKKAEKMLNITHYQRNANQNHYEVPFHTSQNGCDPKVYK